MVAMNMILLIGLMLCVAGSEAVDVLTKTSLVSLTVWTANIGVTHGFFGFFRRRTKAKSPARVPQAVEEMAAPPSDQGNFQFPQGGGMFNPFQFGGNFFQQQGMPQQHSSPFQGHSFQSGSFQDQVAQQMAQQNIPQHMQDEVFKQMKENPPVPDDMDFSPVGDSGSPGINAEEAESFFTLLAETDESQCISRLVCEMGADPVNSGEFGQTIADMISNLSNFPPGSKVAYYNDILQLGARRGIQACSSRFSSCDNESLQMVRNAQAGED